MALNLDDYLERILLDPTSESQARNEALQELRRREEARTALGKLYGFIIFCIVLTFAAQLFIERRGDVAPAWDFRRGVGALGSAAACVLWCFAWLAVGCLLGFLFGIPKIAQPQANAQTGDPSKATDASHAAAQYRQMVNTNLGDISDWLTKIFVGLGLVELRKAPDALSWISEYMSRGACAVACVPLAGAIVLTFSVLGFLCGYLATRMFLAPAFGRADTVDVTAVREAKVSAPEAVLGPAPKPAAALVAPAQAQKKPAGGTSRAMHDLAKRALLEHRYKDAAAAYAALAGTTDDPSIHYEYARALSEVESPTSPNVCAELEKAAAKADLLDPETRQALFIWITYAYLYREEMKGYEKTIQHGEAALAKGIKAGAILINLACAYAQSYKRTNAPADKQKVIEYINRASAEGVQYRDRLRELLVKRTGKPAGDDDLEIFETDKEVRDALGLK